MSEAARIRLIVAACFGLAGAVLFIILFWVFSGSLEDWETLVAGGVFALLLAGIGALARRGRVTLAAWLLVGLLTLIIALDITGYGIGSPSAAAFVLPIALAGRALGLWAALGTAGVSAAAIWLTAWGTVYGGWLETPAPIDHFTFNAPALTVIMALTALIGGVGGKTDER